MFFQTDYQTCSAEWSDETVFQAGFKLAQLILGKIAQILTQKRRKQDPHASACVCVYSAADGTWMDTDTNRTCEKGERKHIAVRATEYTRAESLSGSAHMILTVDFIHIAIACVCVRCARIYFEGSSDDSSSSNTWLLTDYSITFRIRIQLQRYNYIERPLQRRVAQSMLRHNCGCNGKRVLHTTYSYCCQWL